MVSTASELIPSPSRLDRAIEWLSPRWALDRRRAKFKLRASQAQARAFDAASFGRRTEGWRATGTSANAESDGALSTIRNRSRELGRNNPFARRAVESIAANAVGKGITAHIDGPSQKLETAWMAWATSAGCDYGGQLDLYGIQALVARTVAESGECLVRRSTPTTGSGIPLKLQVLEPDFLDDFRTEPKVKGHRIVQGVEFDAKGQRYGYWLYREHPGEVTTVLRSFEDSVFVPAAEIVHCYEILRPGQVRGIPRGTAALLTLKEWERLQDALLIRQEIANCWAVFLLDPDSGQDAGGSSDKRAFEYVEPGMVERLRPGQDVKFAAPPAVDGGDAFPNQILRSIAAGYGTTFEQLTGNYRELNFSSGRMGRLEFERSMITFRNQVLVRQLCDTVWGWFLTAARLAGVGTANASVHWTAPRREMIQPQDEIPAIIAAIRAGLMTLKEAQREQGLDPEAVQAEIERTNAELDEKGIILDSDPRHGKAGAGAAPQPEESNADEDQGDDDAEDSKQAA